MTYLFIRYCKFSWYVAPQPSSRTNRLSSIPRSLLTHTAASYHKPTDHVILDNNELPQKPSTIHLISYSKKFLVTQNLTTRSQWQMPVKCCYYCYAWLLPSLVILITWTTNICFKPCNGNTQNLIFFDQPSCSSLGCMCKNRPYRKTDTHLTASFPAQPG